VIENCKGNANGLGSVSQGREHTIEEVGKFEEEKVERVSGFPDLWLLHMLIDHDVLSPRMAQPPHRRKSLPSPRDLCEKTLHPQQSR
jgi:hypothetical protein